MCIFFELIRKGSCSRIGLALFPKELMSTTFPLPQSLPLDSEEDDDFEFNSVIIFSFMWQCVCAFSSFLCFFNSFSFVFFFE
ncbi:hypothetical protein YC2023_060338 [Brassica napus]